MRNENHGTTRSLSKGYTCCPELKAERFLHSSPTGKGNNPERNEHANNRPAPPRPRIPRPGIPRTAPIQAANGFLGQFHGKSRARGQCSLRAGPPLTQRSRGGTALLAPLAHAPRRARLGGAAAVTSRRSRAARAGGREGARWGGGRGRSRRRGCAGLPRLPELPEAPESALVSAGGGSARLGTCGVPPCLCLFAWFAVVFCCGGGGVLRFSARTGQRFPAAPVPQGSFRTLLRLTPP